RPARPPLPSLPYPPLFRSLGQNAVVHIEDRSAHRAQSQSSFLLPLCTGHVVVVTENLHLQQPPDDDQRPHGEEREQLQQTPLRRDRKSTRLNYSHQISSYA